MGKPQSLFSFKSTVALLIVTSLQGAIGAYRVDKSSFQSLGYTVFRLRTLSCKWENITMAFGYGLWLIKIDKKCTTHPAKCE